VDATRIDCRPSTLHQSAASKESANRPPKDGSSFKALGSLGVAKIVVEQVPGSIEVGSQWFIGKNKSNEI